MNEYRYTKTASVLGKLVHVIRIFGVFTAIVMFGVGVDIAIHHYQFGLYVMVMALLVFFLEITWAITLFLNVCIKNEFSPIFNFWEVVLWLRLWKKSLLYTVFAVVLFFWPHGLWLSNVAGALLLWLSFLYIIVTFKDFLQKRSDFVIVPKGQASTSYDQYDDITDLLGDTIHASLSADNLSELDQDGILEL
ncbi:Transmembrane protein 72 [Cinara cedri]|uniref:Transmembrane protein 72 n=1 Tax=Cinara cedri TaxID=506608 RepID=A0A5E4MM35_9HEMI|nr:Transmembrane protein 72 [Cinara cedri]